MTNITIQLAVKCIKIMQKDVLKKHASVVLI